jgi:IS30 family transposase
MTGMTITEMAELLNLSRDTIKRRILRGGYKPITKDAIYSADVFEAIRNVPGKGRPKKPPESPGSDKPKGKKG